MYSTVLGIRNSKNNAIKSDFDSFEAALKFVNDSINEAPHTYRYAHIYRGDHMVASMRTIR